MPNDQDGRRNAPETLRDDERSAPATIRDGRAVTATVRDQLTATIRDDGDLDPGDITSARAMNGHSKYNVREGTLLRLPAALSQRFTIVRRLPTAGSEADLLLVERNDGELFVVKLYRPNIEPKSDVIEAVSKASPEHVIIVHEYGHSEGSAYELLEYARHGSLRELLSNGPVDDVLAKEILHELSIAISHLHGANIIHRDLKPENILIRTREPLDLIFTDFGISSLATATMHFTKSGSRTLWYGAPESATGAISPAVDYWALGMVMVEALTGVHPFEGMSDAVINRQLATKPVDLTLVPERWKRLCEGLLIRDPSNRWGEDQVFRWVKGERDIPIPRDVLSQTSDEPFPFNGRMYTTLSELVCAFAQNWDMAVKAVERGNFSTWVQQGLRDYEAFNKIDELVEDASIGKDERLFTIIASFAPQLPPIWKGHPLGHGDLIAMASSEEKLDDVLFEVYNHGLLSKYHNIVGASEYMVLERQWAETVRDLRVKWDQIVLRGAPAAKRPSDKLLVSASLLAVTTPSFLAQLQSSAERCEQEGATDSAWFSYLGRSPPDLIIIECVGEDAIRNGEEVRQERLRIALIQENQARWRKRRSLILLFSLTNGIILGTAMAFIRVNWDAKIARLPSYWDIGAGIRNEMATLPLQYVGGFIGLALIPAIYFLISRLYYGALHRNME